MHSPPYWSQGTHPQHNPKVWGANDKVRCNLGGSRGDLALIRWRLISLSAITINAFHLWMTTDFDGTRVITTDATHHHPPGMREILKSIMLPSSATYVREPIAPGTDRIETLLLNNAGYSSFEAIAATWYHDLLLRGHHANNSTGVESGIFAAYGVRLQPPSNPHDA